MQPGDEVTTPRGGGRVLKVVGMRARVEHDTGDINWVETKDAELHRGGGGGGGASLVPLDAAATVADAISTTDAAANAVAASASQMSLGHEVSSLHGTSDQHQALLACPACGFRTLADGAYGSFDICKVCSWEDDQIQLSNHAAGGCANSESLIEAQRNALAMHPLSEASAKGYERDPAWRPLNASEIAAAEADHSTPTLSHAGLDDPELVYWRVPEYDPTTIRQIQERMVSGGVCELARGLLPDEFSRLELKFGMRFPPEVRAFLAVGVPVDVPGQGSPAAPLEERAEPTGWHNWHWLGRDDVPRHRPSPDAPDRGRHRDTLGTQIDWHAPPDPSDSDDDLLDADGQPIHEDVPPDRKRAWKDARRCELLESCPLLPLFGHRMMPTVSHRAAGVRAGAPVYSMHGNDCICYGPSFWKWLEGEVNLEGLSELIPPEWHAVQPAPPTPWAVYI
jgi:hypothetical protein